MEKLQSVSPQSAGKDPAENVTATPRSTPLISSAAVAALSAILVGFMIIGSLWDLSISENFVNPDNWFGIFFAAYGELPASLALVVSGLLLIVFRNQDNRVRAIGQITGGSLVLTLGIAMGLFMPTRYLEIHPVIVVAIGMGITVAAGLAALKLSEGADRRAAIRVALVLLIVVVVEMIAVNLIKLGWERPRMRFLLANESVEFAPWWSPGTEGKAELIQSGIPSEEFKSFPSGHVGNGAVLMLLTALIPLRASLQRYAPAFFWLGAAWGAAVAVSRVITGAHFVTDTVAGFTVTFIVILVAYRIAFPHKKLTTAASA